MLNIFKKKDKRLEDFSLVEHIDGTCEACGSTSFEALFDFEDDNATLIVCEKCDTVVTKYSKEIESTLLGLDSDYVN